MHPEMGAHGISYGEKPTQPLMHEHTMKAVLEQENTPLTCLLSSQ